MDLKLDKEAFVSELSGTTIAEIYLITATLISGFFLRCCLLLCIPSLYQHVSINHLTSFFLEYATTILPGILTMTLLADYAVYILLAELLTSAGFILSKLRTVRDFSLERVNYALSSSYPVRQPYLTLTRTFVNVFTAIAILAVDFTIYPRRLAKAETYGSGLMDVGVGLFLMAHGLTSPEARWSSTSKGVHWVGCVRLVGRTVRGVLPLLVLGMARLIAVKYTDYQEHITEYGVHWNFFFTIATVRISCSLLHPLLISLPYGHGIVAIVVSTLYQVLLQWGGLQTYLILGPHGDGSRMGFMSANREGLISCIGYVAMYTGWVQLGKWLFKPRKLLMDYVSVFLVLFVVFIVFWLATIVSDHYIQPISRRLVNLTYILWIFSYGVMTLSFFLAIDLTILVLTEVTHVPRPPPYASSTTTTTTTTSSMVTGAPASTVPLCTASAVDYNQLTFFVLANICTGLVNTSMDTLHAGAFRAVTVLMLHMGVLLALSVTLHMWRIKIKF